MAAILEIITGLVFLLGGTALLTIGGGGSPMLRFFGTIHIPIALSFLVVGGLTVSVAKRLVWILGGVLVIVSIIDDVIAFVVVPLPFDGVIGTAVVLITAAGAGYLSARADARSFFRNI